MPSSLSILFIPSLFVILWPLLWRSGRPDHYWGIGKPYLYSFPFLIVCVYTIARTKPNKPHIWERATLAFLIPALGFTNLQNSLVTMDKNFLLPHMGAEHTVNFLQFYNRGIAPLILGAGIAGCLLPRKKMGKQLLVLGLLSALHHYCTFTSAAHLLFHDSIMAAYWLNASLLLCICTPLLILYFHPGKTMFRTILLSILGGYLLGPPSWFHLQDVPIGTAHPEAPHGSPSIGFALPSADPERADFSSQLNQQGSRYGRKAQWWCRSKPNRHWKTKKRESSGITARANLPLSEIDFREIFYRSTTRISLIGIASPPVSALQKHTKYPAVHLWLDRPPNGVRYAAIENDQLEWLGPQAPLEACLIWIKENNTFGGLFTQAEYLKLSQCKDGVYIALGDPKGKPYKWTTPFPCSTPQMK